jgi:hypothetical protein
MHGTALPGLGRPEDERARTGAPILVLVVDGPGVLAAVRSSVEPHRIVAEGPGAFALEEGRLVAASHEAVGPVLAAAGWEAQAFELFAPGSFAPAVPPGGPTSSRRAPGPGASLEGSPAGPDLAALSHKPTLSVSEALALLRHLDGL